MTFIDISVPRVRHLQAQGFDAEARVREAVRRSPLLWVDETGWTIEDSIALAKVLKANGVDVIDCSSGGISNLPSTGAVIEPSEPSGLISVMPQAWMTSTS